MNTNEKLDWLGVLERCITGPIQPDMTYEDDLLDKFLDPEDFSYALRTPVVELKHLVKTATRYSSRDDGAAHGHLAEEISEVVSKLRPVVHHTILQLEKVS